MGNFLNIYNNTSEIIKVRGIIEKDDNFMDLEKFKQQIEFPVGRAKTLEEKILVKGVIARTLRLVLSHPDLAKEYQSQQNKTVLDDEKECD